ncbi:ATPase, AFG1 family [hydrothermal vent metagenome]|uniref:ATPase, AFG1 family n=1 Tax=hydrothermal vent metagenome TaxID=652676 RepID=A0A3B0Z682_9ZZZZ
MTPLERYQADLAHADFQVDAAQQQAVKWLQALYHILVHPPSAVPVWLRLIGRKTVPVQGMYLWGGPGRGKTYLMDCFINSLPEHAGRRVHFHRYMLEVHEALDSLPGTEDPLDTVAGQQASQCRVLCLDEFHVTDVADAMLLAGLLTGLFRRGVVLVATSNTAPDELYVDGLQRQRFLPAIDLLKTHCRVFKLDGDRDFRLQHLQHSSIYQIISEQAASNWLQRRLQELAPLPAQMQVSVCLAGRAVATKALAGDVVWMGFSELCERPRSVRDYLELAREFHTLLLEAVPLMTDEQDEAARRFIHLVDALYDYNVTLIVTAAEAPERLYVGLRLRAAFARTASRLTEMSGQAYLTKPHRPT